MSAECQLCHNGPVTEGGCGNPKCPGRNFDDNDIEIQLPPPLNLDNPKEEEKPKVKSKKEMLDDLNEYGRKVDAGENPPNKPPLPWKRR